MTRRRSPDEAAAGESPGDVIKAAALSAGGERAGEALTLEQAARELPTPDAFRLWVLLAVLPLETLAGGDRAIARRLGVNRKAVHRNLTVLELAAIVERVAGPHPRSPRGVVLARPPLLVGDDRFVRLSRSTHVRHDDALSWRLKRARTPKSSDPTGVVDDE